MSFYICASFYFYPFYSSSDSPPSLQCFFALEFMSGGSVYDYLHKLKGVFKLPSLLKVAIDVSKGMNYLHQNNIIHRDLKAANLLMDENEVSLLLSLCLFTVSILFCGKGRELISLFLGNDVLLQFGTYWIIFRRSSCDKKNSDAPFLFYKIFIS